MNFMDEFNGRRLYAGLKLDYRLGLWASTIYIRIVRCLCGS